MYCLLYIYNIYNRVYINLSINQSLIDRHLRKKPLNIPIYETTIITIIYTYKYVFVAVYTCI